MRKIIYTFSLCWICLSCIGQSGNFIKLDSVERLKYNLLTDYTIQSCIRGCFYQILHLKLPHYDPSGNLFSIEVEGVSLLKNYVNQYIKYLPIDEFEDPESGKKGTYIFDFCFGIRYRKDFMEVLNKIPKMDKDSFLYRFILREYNVHYYLKQVPPIDVELRK